MSAFHPIATQQQTQFDCRLSARRRHSTAINIDRSEPGIPSQRDASAVEATQRGRSRAPPVSAGHVKKPDLLRMRLVEHMERLGGGLQ